MRSPNHGAGGSAFRLVPGQPGPVMMGLNYLGTYKTRAEIDADGVKGSSFLGSPRYEDVDKNGVINDLDMVVLEVHSQIFMVVFEIHLLTKISLLTFSFMVHMEMRYSMLLCKQEFSEEEVM